MYNQLFNKEGFENIFNLLCIEIREFMVRDYQIFST